MTGHHNYSFFPAGMYAHLIKIGRENELSVKELEVMFVRDWLERFGFKCEHPHTRLANAHRDPNKPYCKECWTRLQKKETMTSEGNRLVKKTEFVPIETFVDRWNADNESMTVAESKGKQVPKQREELNQQVKEDLK